MSDKPTREQIIDTLKALPGVTHSELWPYNGGDKFVVEIKGGMGKAVGTVSVRTDDSLEVVRFNATLAEAVAALTPATCSPVPQDAIDELVAAAEVSLDRLDYLQNLWGKEAITNRTAETMRAAIARVKGGA